jgi:hypothetical protein
LFVRLGPPEKGIFMSRETMTPREHSVPRYPEEEGRARQLATLSALAKDYDKKITCSGRLYKREYDAAVVYGGITATDGQLIASLKDDSVVCLGAKK